MGVWARGAEAGAGAALAALLLLLLLALLLRRRLRAHKATSPEPAPRAPSVPLVLLRTLPNSLRRTPIPLATTPPLVAAGAARPRSRPSRHDDSVQRGPPPTAAAAPQPPPPPPPAPPAALPRLPLPEQWLLHKRPPDTQYASAIARPLQHMLVAEPAQFHTAVSTGACTPRTKYSVTRSPSLEKDDRSPFVGKEAPDGARHPDRVFEFEETKTEGATALRRYRSVSTRLDTCGAADSPRYFTPPERPNEPAFFAEPEPKSVYYDTVRSPRFFVDTPRTPRTPVASPPLPKQRSPKPHGRNKENYFTFDSAALRAATSAGGRPRRYGGRHSMDRERYTPPADHEARTYRRHNSADTDIASHRLVLIETVPRTALAPACAVPTAKNGLEGDAIRARRQRIKSASLDSEYTPVGPLPAAPLTAPPYHKHLKEKLNLAQREHARALLQHAPSLAPVPPSIASPSLASPRSPDVFKRTLRPAADASTFVDAPRFSPKELEITVTSEEGATCRASLPEHSDGDDVTASAVAPAPTTVSPCTDDKTPRRGRNPRNLTIDLSRRDADLERELREFERLYSDRPRTPTLKVKATSLDSSEGGAPCAPLLHPPAPTTASVPNTPKRQPRRLLAVARRPAAPADAPPSLAVHYKQSLSVSSTNLKTLPEGVPSDDFSTGTDDGRAHRLLRRDSHHALLPSHSPHASCASLGDAVAPGAAPTPSGSRNCLLQRRGSNHSLTLNIGGITAPHTPAPTPTPAVGRSGLLERRASNTSLTLSMAPPQNALATSVSQQELGATAAVRRGGILERRASNTSLTLSLGGEPEPRALHPPPHHRKALSNEDLVAHARPTPHPAYGSHGSLARRTPLTYVAGDRDDELIYAVGAPEEVAAAAAAGSASGAGPVVISTRPLSPQSTSEEFRQYLANMQHLQTASSVLTRRQLRDLHDLFQHGYADAAGGGADPDDRTAMRQRSLLRTLHREFWDMPSNLQEKPLVAGSHAKNRYRSILPNEHSRVRLTDDTDDGSEGDDDPPAPNPAADHPPGPSPAADDPPEIYINANYIKGQEEGGPSYVATQGPLPNTIYDFWLMVQQQWARWARAHPDPVAAAAAQRVVMLTELVEGGRAKCEPYFPLVAGECCTYRSESTPHRAFTVTALAVHERAGYVVRRLSLEHSHRRRPPVPVLHYWFRDWADHRCPGDAAALLRLALDLEPPAGDEDGPPAVVHCSAGVGRTGCLLAVLGGLRQLRRERRVDVLGIVCGLRLDRGGMLQTSEQYELVHRVLARYERDYLPPEPEPD